MSDGNSLTQRWSALDESPTNAVRAEIADAILEDVLRSKVDIREAAGGLLHGSLSVRKWTAWILKECGARCIDAAQQILTGMKDDDLDVRASCAECLLWLEGTWQVHAIGTLLDHLEDLKERLAELPPPPESPPVNSVSIDPGLVAPGLGSQSPIPGGVPSGGLQPVPPRVGTVPTPTPVPWWIQFGRMFGARSGYGIGGGGRRGGGGGSGLYLTDTRKQFSSSLRVLSSPQAYPSTGAI
jgi:hypothetical protein